MERQPSSFDIPTREGSDCEHWKRIGKLCNLRLFFAGCEKGKEMTLDLFCFKIKGHQL
jgi:hypothetical protein